MNWDKYRREDDSIDIIRALKVENNYEADGYDIGFIKTIESYREIKSRQLAALIMALITYGALKDNL